MTNLKLTYSSKNVLGVYFVTYFKNKKNSVFSDFLDNKCGNQLFLRPFHTFRAALKAYLSSLTPSTTTPWLGTPSANSRRTKQFLSRPHGL